MDNIAIALQLDSTQIAIGTEKKGKIFIKSLIELPSIVPYILAEDSEAVNSFFRRIAHEVNVKGAQISISIPTSMAIMNCGLFENVPEEQEIFNSEINRLANRLLHLEKNVSYNVDKALIIKQRKNIRLTSVGVQKKYVDIIWDAAVEAEMILVGIEVEAIAIFRFEGFTKPCCYLEMYEQSFYFTGYLPDNGLFTIKSRYLGDENLKTALLSAIDLFDKSSQKSFGQTNLEAFSIITPSVLYEKIKYHLHDTSYSERVRPTIFSEDIESKQYDHSQLLQSAVAIGILLNSLFERRNQREKIRISKLNRK